MYTREVNVLSWTEDARDSERLHVGIVNNSQKYMGSIAVGAIFIIINTLEKYHHNVSYSGEISVDEPGSPNFLEANFFLSSKGDRSGFGLIKFDKPNNLISRLDILERLVSKEN